MIKNVFYGVMLDINPLKEHRESIRKIDKDIACSLNYDEIKFPLEENDFKKMKYKIIYVSDQTFKSSIDFLLLMINHITSKTLTHLCFIKQKIKIKYGFVKVVYNALVVKMF